MSGVEKSTPIAIEVCWANTDVTIPFPQHRSTKTSCASKSRRVRRGQLKERTRTTWHLCDTCVPSRRASDHGWQTCKAPRVAHLLSVCLETLPLLDESGDLFLRALRSLPATRFPCKLSLCRRKLRSAMSHLEEHRSRLQWNEIWKWKGGWCIAKASIGQAPWTKEKKCAVRADLEENEEE